jgi:hypothetical protein
MTSEQTDDFMGAVDVVIECVNQTVIAICSYKL